LRPSSRTWSPSLRAVTCTTWGITPRRSLGMRQHHAAFAGGDGRQQRGLRGRITEVAQQRHRGDGHVQPGFDQQRRARGLHRQRRLDGPQRQAALLFRHQQAQQAQVGQALPGGGVEAIGTRQHGLAVLEAVAAAHEALHGVLQLLLFVGKGEVHGQSSRIICDTMFFWISLDPPKIVSLRRLQ
jgi:hypothetical protein